MMPAARLLGATLLAALSLAARAEAQPTGVPGLAGTIIITNKGPATGPQPGNTCGRWQ